MSFPLTSAVIRNVALAPAEKIVLLVLADRADKRGIAWPSVATIAHDSGLSERRVRAHLAALAAAGLIRPTGSRAGGRACTVRWQLVLDAHVTGNPVASSRVSSDRNPVGIDTKPCRNRHETLSPATGEAIKKQSRSKKYKDSGTASPRLDVDQPTEGTMTPHRNADRLPEWLPTAAWKEWCSHRGRKLTAPAIRRQLAKLEALRQEGHDPAEIIGHAIEAGWATFYPPKRNPVSRKSDQRTAFANAILGATPNEHHDETPDPRIIDGEAERVA
jgi:hypothetical protein